MELDLVSDSLKLKMKRKWDTNNSTFVDIFETWKQENKTFWNCMKILIMWFHTYLKIRQILSGYFIRYCEVL